MCPCLSVSFELNAHGFPCHTLNLVEIKIAHTQYFVRESTHTHTHHIFYGERARTHTIFTEGREREHTHTIFTEGREREHTHTIFTEGIERPHTHTIFRQRARTHTHTHHMFYGERAHTHTIFTEGSEREHTHTIFTEGIERPHTHTIYFTERAHTHTHTHHIFYRKPHILQETRQCTKHSYAHMHTAIINRKYSMQSACAPPSSITAAFPLQLRRSRAYANVRAWSHFLRSDR